MHALFLLFTVLYVLLNFDINFGAPVDVCIIAKYQSQKEIFISQETPLPMPLAA